MSQNTLRTHLSKKYGLLYSPSNYCYIIRAAFKFRHPKGCNLRETWRLFSTKSQFHAASVRYRMLIVSSTIEMQTISSLTTDYLESLKKLIRAYFQWSPKAPHIKVTLIVLVYKIPPSPILLLTYTWFRHWTVDKIFSLVWREKVYFSTLKTICKFLNSIMLFLKS